MKLSQLMLLLLVSAIWGASHSLIRITVPEWGSVMTAFLRVSIAALTLFFILKSMKKEMNFKANFKEFLVVACLNAAFPIFLFSYAAQTLPASYLVILNATTPLFNAVFSSVFLSDRFTLKKACGIMLGVAGIILLEERGTIPHLDSKSWFAMGCVLLASASYGLVAVYLKRLPKKIDPIILTTGSNLVGSFLFLPFAFQENWHWSWGPALPAILVLGVFGSGIAFVIYYRLLNEIGAFQASMTTFIMPVFGLFWGWLFLNETANLPMMIGVGLIISATALLMQRVAKKD